MSHPTAPETDSRSARLKAATHAAHEVLDQSVMRNKPFSSKDLYGQFVKVQHVFHTDIHALYDDAQLDALLPDLQGRRRLAAVTQDLKDLEVAPFAPFPEPRFAPGAAVDLPYALGWLYVAEGSNLGAAFLLKAAAQLGLSDRHGARHLAGAPEGRGLHWRTFTAALNEIEIDAAAEARVIQGAEDAFRRVQGLIEEVYAAAPATA